jgi:hypothetical protein
MGKLPLFALVAALAACGGRTSADAVAAERMSAAFSFDGEFSAGASEDLPAAVRRHALESILSDARAHRARRVYGCNYSFAEAMVRWNCEDSGSLTAQAFAASMLQIDPGVEAN